MSLFKTAKPHLASVKNYVPGKPLEELEREYGVKNAVKMASNENALGPSPKAVAAAKRALSRAHRYPEGGCHYLRQKLSKTLGVAKDQLVFGNGSDELLVFAVRAFAGPGDEIVCATPSFLIYEIAGTVENARVVKVPMKDFRYDLERMLAAITPRTKLVFIANPDNPVGTYIPAARLSSFLARVPQDVLVVLDEAYYEFARVKKDYPDSMKLLKEFRNLIVTRTFSKAYGLAGLRVGYAAAAPGVAEALEKVREPFNVNALAQTAALAALDDRKFLKKSVETVNRGRKLLTNALQAMGLRTVDTVTNFILFDAGRDASPLYEKMLRDGVIVRPMGGWGLKSFLRVTIGTQADNKRFLKALKRAMAAVLLVIGLQGAARADVVAHTNGQTLEGVITSEDDKQVTIEVEGMALVIPREEVRAIRKGPLAKKKKTPTPEAVEQAAVEPVPSPEPAPRGMDLDKLERPLLVLDERKWKVGFQDARNNQLIAEYVLEGETVEDWTELVTAQLFVGLKTEPAHFVEYVRQKTAETCPQTRWRVVRTLPNDVLYEWSVSACGGIPDQSEIARTVLGQDGLHVLHYAKKTGELSEEEKAKWILNLEATQIVKP